MKISRKSVMQLASALYRNKIITNWVDAQKVAWKQAQQGENEVTFVKKSTGQETTRRIAKITTQYYQPAKNSKPKKHKPGLFRFIDLDKFEKGIKDCIISFYANQVRSFA